MAGVAWREGLTATLVRHPASPGSAAEADVAVLDTDSRLMSAGQAAKRVRQVVRDAVAQLAPSHIFKKIDSVFRGPVGPELAACLHELGWETACVLVASPATNRHTAHGLHYVAGRPLGDSEFARDPWHPVTESDLTAILREQTDLPVTSVSQPVSAVTSLGPGVAICDARTTEDLQAWAEALPDHVLAAGSAAFGQALLRRWKQPGVLGRGAADMGCASGGTTLIVNGSLSDVSRRQTEEFRRCGGGVIQTDAPADQATIRAISVLSEGRAALLASPRARRLCDNVKARQAVADALAHVASQVLERALVDTLAVSGGHTAGCLFRELGWDVLTVVGEFGQGIVALRPVGSAVKRVILKPGSYGGEDLFVRLAMPANA